MCNKIIKEHYLKLNSNGVIIYSSKDIKDIFQLEAKDIIGENISNLFKEKTIDINNNHSSIVTFNGNTKKSPLTIFYKTNILGELKNGIILILIDISKYKSNSLHKIAMELKNIKQIVYSFQIIPKINFNYINEDVKDVLGVEVKELLDCPMLPYESVHSEDYNLLLNKILGKIDYCNPIIARYKLKDTECEYVTLEENIIPTYDNQGNVVLLEGVATDIKTRKKIENYLKQLF